MEEVKKDIAMTNSSVEDDMKAAIKMTFRDVENVNKILSESPHHDTYTQEEMDLIDARHSYSAVFEKIRQKFIKKYNFNGADLEIIHDRSFRGLKVYYVKDEKGGKVFCDTFFLIFFIQYM